MIYSLDRHVASARECVRIAQPISPCLAAACVAAFHIMIVKFNWFTVNERDPIVLMLAVYSVSVTSAQFSTISTRLEARGSIPDFLPHLTLLCLWVYYCLGSGQNSLLAAIALATGIFFVSLNVWVSQVVKWYFVRLTSLT